MNEKTSQKIDFPDLHNKFFPIADALLGIDRLCIHNVQQSRKNPDA